MAVSNIKALIPGELQKVWDLVLDIENYGAWRSDLSKAEVISDKKFIEYTKEGYPTTFTVTLATPYRRWEFDMENSNTIVKNKEGEVSSCDLSYNAELNQFNEEYLKYTAQVAASCQDRDLSENSMVIGTSAIIDTEIDGAVGMNSGIFNNPFIIWGRYKKKWFRYYLPLSFQFHHTQMDGAHAGVFLKNLQNEINLLK